MFLQAAPSTNWATNTYAESMVPVGPDAMAMLSNNIVICYNLKNESRAYFKADNAQTCAGISLLTGHLRYPLFAVAESVLRPRIFVISYPDMEKLTTVYHPEVLMYVDIALSEYEYLVALGDYPNYRLVLWDYRSGEKLAEAKTYKKCSRGALYCMKSESKGIIQYSKWHNQLCIWQLYHNGDKGTLFELSKINLSNDFVLSNFCPVTYWEASLAYVINDLGELFWIDVAQMVLRHAWSTPKTLPDRHSLYFNKNGLIIINSSEVFFIKKRQGHAREWDLEWTLPNTDGYIKKMISDNNNNMHIATRRGNIYRIQYADQVVSLIPEMVANCYVIDYTSLKGIKDEVVLLLTKSGDLRLVDLIRMNTYSTYHVDNVCSISVHNTSPYVAAATTIGIIHFISYEKIRAPIELGLINIGDVGIDQIRLLDHCVFIKDKANGLHIMSNEYKTKKFQIKISLACESQTNWNMLDMFLLDEQRSMIFLNENDKPNGSFANQVWIYTWDLSKTQVTCAEYDLFYDYKCFTVTQSSSSDIVEFMGVRLNSNIIDAFVLTKNTINIAYALKTIHFANVSCISGNRNILTADTQSLIMHFRTHKKSKFAYGISRALLCNYVPNIIVKMDEYFNAKYLVVLGVRGCLSAYRLPILVDSLRENKFETNFNQEIIQPRSVEQKKLLYSKVIVKEEVTDKDLDMKDALIQELRSIEKAITELIDFDMYVIGLDNMNFQKFCLNRKWLEMLIEEARLLRESERVILYDAIADQSRIRDWIFDLIKSKSTVFSTKLRSIFSAIFVESYSTRASTKELLDRFDLFRFYEMEPLEDEIEELPNEDELLDDDMGEEEEEIVVRKAIKRYILEKGENVYEHVMAKDFELQDIKIVTFNQLYNEEAKQAVILTDALKAEFNKNFILSKNFKEEIMENVYATNGTLQKIYSNMNCMLCLLKMDQFEPPALTVPEWERDENIQKILTVDDSEIKAINRRKKAVVAAAHKSGRMLLWSADFWKRALLVMMDGVLEKLWEEEIKKTPLPPEFMLKKQEHEFNLEDHKLKRQYENLLKVLEEDRKKYLRILRDNEVKTYSLKKHFVVKLNEHVAELDIQKMKYDFAVKHERLRLLNIKLTNFKRIECKNLINKYKLEIIELIDYISKYEKILESYEHGKTEYKSQYEFQLHRDKQLDRQFKGQYLNTIPQHLTAEMTKIYRKRPKLPNKVFSTSGTCFEIGRRLVSKKIPKFPLPQDLLDFLNLIQSLDSAENCPTQLDLRYWDNFAKLRRQKFESELRLKGIQYSMHEVTRGLAFITDEIRKLKENFEEKNHLLTETTEEYFDVVHNQRLELVLSMGQVELKCTNGDLNALRNGVLMHVDDINEVNSLIKLAGQQKIKAMQRVAFFRRQVIYKEWEHRVVRANIEYLHYIRELVERCRVNHEFLVVLRNWHRLKEMQATTTRVGLIEEVIEKRLAAARKQLDRLDKRICEVRGQLDEKKRQNHFINFQVDSLKVDVTYLTVNRDFLGEEKKERINSTRMGRAMQHGWLSEKVRSDYVKILELCTILDITRWHTYEMLPPVEAECLSLDGV